MSRVGGGYKCAPAGLHSRVHRPSVKVGIIITASSCSAIFGVCLDYSEFHLPACTLGQKSLRKIPAGWLAGSSSMTLDVLPHTVAKSSPIIYVRSDRVRRGVQLGG